MTSVLPKRPRSGGHRAISPPMRWGQAVAPPPTPFFTPQTSPGGSSGNVLTENNEVEIAVNDVRVHGHPRRRHRRPRPPRLPPHHQSGLFRVSPVSMLDELPPDMVSDEQVITYSYRFGAGGSIDRQPIVTSFSELGRQPRAYHNSVPSVSYQNSQDSSPVQQPPPPNSQSTSPMCTGSSGTSPEAVQQKPLTTSPVSPPLGPQSWVENPCIRSAMRMPDNSVRSPRRKSRKCVQWMSDVKRKPQSNLDRRMVKNQV